MHYLLNIMHAVIYFYSSLRNTCVFDTSPWTAFDLRGYFDVLIELIVKVASMVFEDTSKVVHAFLLKCRHGKFIGRQIRNKQTILFTCDLFCITGKLQLLDLTTRWYFSINCNVHIALSASCSSPALSTAVTSSRLGGGS